MAKKNLKKAPVKKRVTAVDEFDAYIASLGLLHFRPRELREMGAAHEGNGLNTLPPKELWPNIAEAALAADALRTMLGAPLAILSGYRSPAYNKAIKGAKGSLHMQFRALDLAPTDKKLIARLGGCAHILRKKGVPGCRGIGTYKWGIHIDNGEARDW